MTAPTLSLLPADLCLHVGQMPHASLPPAPLRAPYTVRPSGCSTRTISSTPTCAWTTLCFRHGLQVLFSSILRLVQGSLCIRLSSASVSQARVALRMNNFAHRCASRLETTCALPRLCKGSPRNAVSLATTGGGDLARAQRTSPPAKAEVIVGWLLARFLSRLCGGG